MSSPTRRQGSEGTTGAPQNDFIKKVNLSDIVVQKITAAVRKGELKAGDRLPSHDELCERWGISRTTIREALNKLESMGVLTKFQGRGTYINQVTAREATPVNQMGAFLDEAAVLQLLEARKVVEPLIAGLAARRRTEEELEALRRLLEQMEQAKQRHDHELYSRADHDFHLLIVKMSRNPFLEMMMRNLGAPLAVQQMEVIASKPGEQARICAESQRWHQSIFEAIRGADPAAARDDMQSHLESVRAFMQDNLCWRGCAEQR